MLRSCPRLLAEWVIFRDMWRDLIDLGQTSNPSLAWKDGRFQNDDDIDDD